MNKIIIFIIFLICSGCSNKATSDLENQLCGKYSSESIKGDSLILFQNNIYTLGIQEKGEWEIVDYGDFTILNLMSKNRKKEAKILFERDYCLKFDKSIFNTPNDILLKKCQE